MLNIEIYNSFSQFSGELTDYTNQLIAKVLTYENDNEAEIKACFGQINRAKKQKEYAQKSGDPQKMEKARRTIAMLSKKIKHLEDTKLVCWYNSPVFPTGHLNLVKKALDIAKIPYQEFDRREVPTNDIILPWYNKPFDPRYYQSEMHEIAMREKRGVIVSAVGTGKSLVMAYLVKALAVNSLIVVPSRGLLGQLANDFNSWFGQHMVEDVTTARVRSNKPLKPLRLVTVQTLASLQKSGELSQLVHDVKALYVDEIHHAGSSSYTNLLAEIPHIYYRFGFTGTFLRNDSKSLDMWGFLSNVLYRYSAQQAIADGFLTPMKLHCYELPGVRKSRYPTEYDHNYCNNKELYRKVYEIVSSAKPDEQILILVNRKDKAGRIFHEYLLQNGIANNYISGDDKKDTINATIEAFNLKKIRVLIGSSVIGEGIDVRSTDHLIMCQGGKSEIVMVQAVGRAIRLFPGKEVANVHDFDFKNTAYMGKHWRLRKEIYARNFDCEFIKVPN